MLILSRKINQQILINGNIQVTVLSVKGARVQLGFDAPSSVGIRRKELPFQHESEPRDSRAESVKEVCRKP